jgi:hypothetical protein
MAQAASTAGIRPDEVSFRGALQTFNAFFPYLLTASSEAEEADRWAAMIAAIAEHRVGNRPDRHEPRAARYRKRKFPRLTMPRREARRFLKEGGSFEGDKD